MKMKKEDFEELKTAVNKVVEQYPTMWEVYKSSGISPKRYRWDCLHLINKDFRLPWFLKVYKYLNDNHIDTALKKITSPERT